MPSMDIVQCIPAHIKDMLPSNGPHSTKHLHKFDITTSHGSTLDCQRMKQLADKQLAQPLFL